MRCTTPLAMMKENGSLSSKMLNGDWVLKRKRRKLPSGPDTSNGKEKASKPLDLSSSNSSKSRVKSEITSSRSSSSKKKGNDGVSMFFMIYLISFSIYGCDSTWQTRLELQFRKKISNETYSLIKRSTCFFSLLFLKFFVVLSFLFILYEHVTFKLSLLALLQSCQDSKAKIYSAI